MDAEIKTQFSFTNKLLFTFTEYIHLITLNIRAIFN